MLNYKYKIKWSYNPCSYECNFCNYVEKPGKFRTSVGFEPIEVLNFSLHHKWWCRQFHWSLANDSMRNTVMLAGEAKGLLFYLVAIARMSSIHSAASLVFSLIEIVRGGIAISNNLIGRYLQEIPDKCHPQFLKVPRKSRRHITWLSHEYTI